ncbi:YEATS domain-containing protein 2 [Frankliniella fusca]|uniref:YEATS domain-containing protein 2 n=1 Tax=Frankliniella fusca TaxID=407009 RepID=A0AAE1LRV0_9NEOP|nr:YEATS domain-containing protein 2 [Frankliniella fusca]
MEESRDVDQPTITVRFRELPRHASRGGLSSSQSLLPVCVVGNNKSDPELMRFLGATQRSPESVYEVQAAPNVVLDRLKSKGYRMVSKKIERMKLYGSETVAEVWIHREQPKTEVSSEEKSHDTQQTIKLEPDDFIENSMALSEETCTIPTSSSMELSNSSIKIEPTVSTLLESSQIAAEKTQPLYGEPNAPQPLVQTATTTSKAELICKTEEPPSNFSTPFKSTFTQVSSVKNDATSPKVTRTAADESSPHTFQSPANTVSSSGTISAIQTTQVPPTKPGTQLVKCIDSKGNVRLLQVRTDLLPKILKRGSTTIPATPPSSKEASLSNKTINPEKAVAPVTRAIQQTLPAKIVPPQGSTDTPPTVSQLPQSSQTTSAPVLPGTIKVTVTSPAIAQGIQTGVSPAVGVRPILQIVKPAGNLNVRPMLVVPNAASQQIIRLPASAASAGNRPLYVLKDGKLFMMKSALNAASKKIIPDAKTPSNILASREIAENLAIKTETAPAATTTILKTNLTKTANPSLTTKETPIVTSSMTNSHPQVTSNVTKIAIDNTSDTVKITPKSNVALNAGLGLKVISPPGLSKLAPVGDTAISSVKKVHPTQQFTHPQSVSSPTVIPKATLKSGKSLLKPAVSLLKSNVGASTTGNNVNKPFPVSNNLQPLSKVSTSAQSPLPTAPVLDGFTATKRIVLGRTSGSSTITTYSQQALLSTIQACPKGPEEDVWRAVRWMIKNLPLINSEAKNLEFKILHPYCAPDEKTFCSWNIGKQRACEWQRAKTVRHLLKEAGWDQQNLWTTREIILWARFHGYTPGLPVLKSHQPRNIPCDRDDGCESPMAVMCNYGKIPDVEEWLEFPEKPSPLSNTNQQSEVVNLSDESEEEIDVTTTNSPSKVKVKQETDNVGTVDISEKMPLEPSLHTLSDMVTRSLNNIGLHLSSQELVSGVHYPAAQRVLIQTTRKH